MAPAGPIAASQPPSRPGAPGARRRGPGPAPSIMRSAVCVFNSTLVKLPLHFLSSPRRQPLRLADLVLPRSQLLLGEEPVFIRKIAVVHEAEAVAEPEGVPRHREECRGR